MTIEGLYPNKGTRSEKDKLTCDENTPLLPVEQEESMRSVEFRGASFTGSVFNLSTTIIGAGIMALPAAVKVLGLGIGIAVMICMAFFTDASIGMLLRFSKAGKTVSYGGVMGDYFGKCGRILLQVCILVNNIGVLIVYMIIIGDVLSGTSSGGIYHTGVLGEWFGEHWWNGRPFVLFTTTLVVFVPLACFKRIESLRFTSALSVLLAVVFLFITVGITVMKLMGGTVAMPRMLPVPTDLPSFCKLFTVVPVLVTAYLCHYNVHTINNELQDSTQIKAVVRTSLVFSSTVYIMVSFFSLLLFGEETLDDVLANFGPSIDIPYTSVFNAIVRVSYAGHLVLVFPVIFFPLRVNLDGLMFPAAQQRLTADNLRFTLITAGLIVAIFSGANFIPSVWDAFQFTGATAAVCIGFIFPAAITLRNSHGIGGKDNLLSIMMIVLAVFSNMLAIYNDTYSLLKKNLPQQG